MPSLSDAAGPASASSTPPLKRKIAAILAADVAGYSRLIAENEEATLHALADARAVFDARVARAGGRIFNTAGDSIMCEFDSAVEAVRAAVDIQAELGARSAPVVPGRKLAFRIGITIGDVVERDGDLLGDGVNIAARLEALAPAGGICVSRSVHEAVANKISASFTELGPQHVKNIPRPLHAYLIAPPAAPDDVGASGPRVLAAERGADRARDPARSRLGPRLAWTATLAFTAVAVPLLLASGWLGSGGPTAVLPRTGETATPSRAETGSRLPPSAADRADAKPATVPKAAEPKAAGAAPIRRLPVGEAAAIFSGRAAEGIIADPRTVPELYHNARLLETRGDRAGARQAYAAAAPAAGDAIDFHLRYASLLRAAAGPAAARQAYAELARTAPSRAVALAGAIGSEPGERRARVETLAAEPDDLAAQLVLAETLLDPRLGGPTLTDRRLAHGALDRFLEEASADGLSGRLIDRGFLEGWLDTARRKRGEVEQFFAGTAMRPTAGFRRTGTGWTVQIGLPEPATAVTVRVGEGGPAIPAGQARAAGGTAATAAELELPAGTARTTLYVAYRDRSGREAGPFPLVFDPVAATAESGRDALERYPETWVAFRPDVPDLLSVAGLVSNRCAIRRATIGFGDAQPREPVTLPACDASGPAAMPSGVVGSLTLPDGVDAVQVQLTYADGSESQVRTFRRP